MTDAPENITLKPNHLFGNPWSNAYIGDDDPMEDGEDTSYGYTRTDVADARIKELEATLQEERSAKWEILEHPLKNRVEELEGDLEMIAPYLKDMTERGDDEAKALLEFL
jgi:hypothetical protein